MHEANVVTTSSPGNCTTAPRRGPVTRSRRTPTCRSSTTLLTLLVQSLEKQGKRDEAEVFRKKLAEKYIEQGVKKR